MTRTSDGVYISVRIDKEIDDALVKLEAEQGPESNRSVAVRTALRRGLGLDESGGTSTSPPQT